jgi:HK97 gp10 family phage protein
MNVRIQLQDSLTASLASLPLAVNRTVQVAALKAGAEPMRAEAESRAPYDEEAGAPHLKTEIVIAVPTELQLAATGDETAVVWFGPTKRAFWGLFQEFGYGPGPAQPFMRPAFDTQQRRSFGIIQARLWDAIRGYLGRGHASAGGRFT